MCSKQSLTIPTPAQQSSGSSAMPLSQIEKSVTHLLVATKSLLETLTQWSRGQASDTQVSDVYVRLGYEFNMACRAFTAINVDTSDLGNVPEKLRSILEATLSQEASVESLENYLPKIRDIIINLLHGLKRKQQKLRQRQPRDRENIQPGQSEGAGGAGVSRVTSTSTTGSNGTGLSSMLSEGIENGYRPDQQQPPAQPAPPPSKPNSSPNRRFPGQRDQSQSRSSGTSDQSSLSSNTMQNIPVLAPYPGDDTIPVPPPIPDETDPNNFPPPPPPPKQQSALAALQRGGDLERRASRRYSAYQISKHLGNGVNSVPMMPQMGPIPNRGRGDIRESMRAVQGRTDARHSRNAPSQGRTAAGDSPVRVPSRVSEEPDVEPKRISYQLTDKQYPETSATLNGPPSDDFPIGGVREDEELTPQNEKPAMTLSSTPAAPEKPSTPEKKAQSFSTTQPSPAPSNKELTLFLQYKSKVKKFVLAEGHSELSIGRLQLAFIDKFSWNTQHNGVDLPEIYIQDPVSGVRHELEDLADIKDRTVLALNVEPLDEVKRHIDEGLGSIKQMVREVKQNVDDHATALARVSDRQQEAVKEMARLASAYTSLHGECPKVSILMIIDPTYFGHVEPSSATVAAAVSRGGKANSSQLTELRNLRRDLAVIRQTYSTFQSDIEGSMAALRAKANNVKVAVAKASVPDTEGGGGQAYVIKGRKQLSTDSDRLVGKVDDLQDMVEDLRKDVVHRGVRPLPRQLETVSRDIQGLTQELRKMAEYMKREKPIWTKIWEKELEDVCQGREELRIMEDLVVDLQDDLEKASETFGLVEQATKEQMKDSGVDAAAGPPVPGTNLLSRQFSRGLENIVSNAAVDPSTAKEGVLGEELTEFVGEGKLKKSGGFEEVERARKARDDRIRREVWERQNGIIPEDPIGEEAADAAAGGDGGVNGVENGEGTAVEPAPGAA
ncbi:bud site selection protein 6 [Magnaporthiopsis poae ATCC 64411]|uniref:Bud site selection protein 6 n=1 Tax=Magnaporthiopsis poae (strain ATCC 64411 / 73-15) TaxID=644358 RepID=A0A0C4DK80_MAGP6|nr:bud site selection protein 6 [Magnaporthiopsis poae ATCC 64411]